MATIGAILLTLIPTYIISYKTKKSETTTMSDWAIADRSLPIYVVVGTQFATAMGGGVLVGQVGICATSGVGYILYGVMAACPFLLLTTIAKWLRKNNFVTVPDIIGKFTNDNKVIKVFAGIMSLIVPFGWFSSQLTAFATIYSILTGMDYALLIIVFAFMSLLFVMPAGLKTVAWTDFIFACFMCVCCIACLFQITSMGGGLGQIVANLNAQDPNLLNFSGSLKHNIGFTTAILWIFSVLPGGMTNQCYYQRICAIDDDKKVNKSLLITALTILLVVAWTVYMGTSIRSINPDAGNNATAWFMGQLPVPFMAIFAALIVATMMSTASSGAQTTVTNITHDIVPVFVPRMDDKRMLKLSRILTLVLVFVGIFVALVVPNIMTQIVATYAFSAATLGCPVFVSYAFRKKNIITTPGIAAGMIGGVVGVAAGMIFKAPISYAAVGMGVSLVAMLVVCALTRNKDVVVLED